MAFQHHHSHACMPFKTSVRGSFRPASGARPRQEKTWQGMPLQMLADVITFLDLRLFSRQNMIAAPVWARTCQLSSSRVLLKHVCYVLTPNMSDPKTCQIKGFQQIGVQIAEIMANGGARLLTGYLEWTALLGDWEEPDRQHDAAEFLMYLLSHRPMEIFCGSVGSVYTSRGQDLMQGSSGPVDRTHTYAKTMAQPGRPA